MTSRHAGLASALLALSSLVVTSASATTPDPRFSTTDLVVVGNSSGTAIGGTPPGFDVGMRDVNNAPIPARVVTLDFKGVTMKLGAVQNAGTTLDCQARTLSRVTDGAGRVNFAPRLAGYDNTNSIRVVSNGEVIASVRGRSTDLDGIDGTTALGDFAIFGNNFLNNRTAVETDYDLDGVTGLGDFALFHEEFQRGALHSYCP